MGATECKPQKLKKIRNHMLSGYTINREASSVRPELHFQKVVMRILSSRGTAFFLVFVSSFSGPWPRESALTFSGETFTTHNKARRPERAKVALSSGSENEAGSDGRRSRYK
jgi:hypothetical protein